MKRLSSIGEFGFIETLKSKTKTSKDTVCGIGDDCAVIKYTGNEYLLYTTDMIIEDAHFKRSSSTPEAIGHKALAVNASDIAACAGIPRWAVISGGFPGSLSVSYCTGIYKGIKALAKKIHVDLVGGDTNKSKKIIVSIALIGTVKKENLLLRSGAKDKDVIVLSGRLKIKPDHLKFMPKINEASFITKHLKPTSMIDISDGFLSDLMHILKNSKKAALIYESLIPNIRKSSYKKLLNEGEQFQLLFTMPKTKLNCLPKDFYPIGEIKQGTPRIVYLNSQGKRENLLPKGYRHF